MQITDILCYLLVTITATATCARVEYERQNRGVSVGKPRKVLKRDAALLIDNFPIDAVTGSVYENKPKVIYRRISRLRYKSPPKPKYGPPVPKYGPPPPSPKPRKPAKKYRKHVSTKYRTSTNKKRAPKPRYGPPKRPVTNPTYRPPNTVPPTYYTPEPAGFAEPPSDYEPHYKPNQIKNYGEPPVDSYGAPIKSSVIDNYPTAPTSNEPVGHYDNQDAHYQQDFSSWQNYPREPSLDNSFAFSKKRPFFIKPEEAFDQQQETFQRDDEVINSYSDAFNYRGQYNEPPYLSNKMKKPQYFTETNKRLNSHWRAPKLKPDAFKDDEILVGGQYAEPPPRYVARFQPSAPMFTEDDDDFSPQQKIKYLDSEVAASATISPYVNYKNSNMAFSPQNLNDAFSI